LARAAWFAKRPDPSAGAHIGPRFVQIALPAMAPRTRRIGIAEIRVVSVARCSNEVRAARVGASVIGRGEYAPDLAARQVAGVA
jgi:hypothetical protein